MSRLVLSFDGPVEGGSVGIAMSPDGSLLAHSTDGWRLELRDTATGEVVDVFEHVGPGTPPTFEDDGSVAVTAAFSPDGLHVATTDTGGRVHLWEVVTRTERHLENLGPSFHLTFSPDSRLLAAAVTDFDIGEFRVVVWDIASGEEIQSWESDPILHLNFHPDGSRLLAANYFSATADEYDLTNGEKRVAVQHTGQIWSAGYLEGERIYTAGRDGDIQVWDPSTGELLFLMTGHGGQIRHSALSADRRWLATVAEDGTGRIWDVSRNEEVLLLSGPTGWMLYPTMSDDASILATSIDGGGVAVWDLSAQSEGEVFGTAFADAFMVNLEREGNRVAAYIRVGGAFSPGPAILIDLADGSQFSVPNRGSFAFITPEGDGLIAQAGIAGENGILVGLGAVELFRADTGGKVYELEGVCPQILFDSDDCAGYPVSGQVNFIDFSPDGRYVAAEDNQGTVGIWDADSGALIKTVANDVFPANEEGEFSPDGTMLATRLVGEIVIYEVPSLEEIARITGLEPRFSPDGSKLAVLNRDDGISLWNTTTWEPEQETTDRLSNARQMNWSDDGTRLVIGGGQSEVHVVDARSLNFIQTVPFPGATAVGVAFVDEDRHVVVGTADGKVLVLTLDTDELVSIASERLTRGLSDDECQLYGIDPCPTLEEIKTG